MATNPTWKNFDPRVGIAFDPFSDHKTSIRAGFGIFRELISVNTFAPGYWTSPPWALSVTPNIPGLSPVSYPTIPFNGPNLGKPSSTPGFDYNSSTTPYVMQYNLNIQREIAKGTVFNIGYVGSKGVHLMTQVNLNPPLVCLASEGPNCASPSYAKGQQAFAPGGAGGFFGFSGVANGQPAVLPNAYLNPNLAQFGNLSPQAWSKYHSLQTSVNRRLTQSIQGQVSYTWSRCMDDGGYLGSFNTNGTSGFTNPYTSASDKGPCSYDINHVFKGNLLYMLPFKANRLVSGWQLSGIFSWSTGLPLNITDGYDQATGGSVYALAARPNLKPGFSNNPIIGTANQWFDPNAFSIQAPGTLGNLGRNTVRGPHYADLDFSLTKETRISERINTQFRAEFFNHPESHESGTTGCYALCEHRRHANWFGRPDHHHRRHAAADSVRSEDHLLTAGPRVAFDFALTGSPRRREGPRPLQFFRRHASGHSLFRLHRVLIALARRDREPAITFDQISRDSRPLV